MGSSPSAELGSRLRQAGLREPLAIAAYGGATGIHAARLAPRAKPLAMSPATAALELLVAGREVFVGPLAAALGGVDPLVELGLVERRGELLHPRVRVVPYRGLLLVCAPDTLPDDSSLHLRGALPERCEGRWLDVGTGSGMAPLSRPRLGAGRLGTDIDPTAIAGARCGAELSGLAGSVKLAVGDLLAAARGRFALISFNAPLPLPAGLLERFWAAAAARLEPGGEVLVHAAGAEPPALGGELVCLRYTPAGAPQGFSVIRWRPDGPAGRRVVGVELTGRAPHISRALFDR